MVLLHNSRRDGRKGDKLQKPWIGPYTVVESLGKGRYVLSNLKNGRKLKKKTNICRLKLFRVRRQTSKLEDTNGCYGWKSTKRKEKEICKDKVDSGHVLTPTGALEMLEQIGDDSCVNNDCPFPKRRQIVNQLSGDSGHTAPHPSTREVLDRIADDSRVNNDCTFPKRR